MVQKNCKLNAPVIAIAGPTAVGKSALAVEIAKRLGGAVVSADSMQVFREMRVGTARPTEEEMQDIPHYMMGIVSCKNPFTVNDFVKAAKKWIVELSDRKTPTVVVGGSGMYLRGLLYGYNFESTEGDEEIRTRYAEFAKEKGNTALLKLLKKKNPDRAAQLHENDVKRVIRALELEELGIKDEDLKAPQETLPHSLYILDCDRDDLYKRINARVDKMFQGGLVEETQRLLDSGISPEAQCMRAIGYAEIAKKLIAGQDPLTAKSEIKQNTRNLAKRQMTYFRAMKPAVWLNVLHGLDALADVIVEKYKRDNC